MSRFCSFLGSSPEYEHSLLIVSPNIDVCLYCELPSPVIEKISFKSFRLTSTISLLGALLVRDYVVDVGPLPAFLRRRL